MTHANPRHDGLTPERRSDFLDALAASGSVTVAAEAIGLSRTAVYNLRRRPEASAFRAAWDEALKGAVAVLAETAFDRALNGVEEPVFYKGEQVGTKRRHNDRLLMFLLKTLDPETYAPRKPKPEAEADPALRAMLARIARTSREASPSSTSAASEDIASVSTSSPLSPSPAGPTAPPSPQREEDAEENIAADIEENVEGGEEDFEDEIARDKAEFRARLRAIRLAPPPKHVSKRTARRLAARQKTAAPRDPLPMAP